VEKVDPEVLVAAGLLSPPGVLIVWEGRGAESRGWHMFEHYQIVLMHGALFSYGPQVQLERR
jgi:hypothetical protein